MKKLALIVSFCIASSLGFAQNSVGIGTTTPDPNAVLDLQSPANDQGLLIPRLDTTAILAMPMNASHDGMLVYAEDINGFVYWDGDSLQWYLLNENFNGGTGDNDWIYNGDTLYNNSSYVVLGSAAADPNTRTLAVNNGVPTALRGISDGDGNIAVGLQGMAMGSASSIGVQGYAESSGGDTIVGTLGQAEIGAGGVGFGVFGAVDNTTNLGYAIFGDAQGTGGGTVVGVFGQAEGGASNWAGYFGPGNVYIENNLGVGIATPGNKLHVFGGSITIDDGANPYTFPISDGAGGDVLTTDGAGNTSWQPVASGGGSSLVDADGDTEINIEAAADQDVIHFSLGNSTGYTAAEYFTMIGPRLEVLNSGNSLFIGEGAGANDDLSANSNVYLGRNAGNQNITGLRNIAIGDNAMLNGTSAGNNIAIGHQALATNTISSNNLAIGYQSLYLNNGSGAQNTAVGNQTLRNNSTGTDNTAIGLYALNGNTTGASNTSIGSFSHWQNTIGSYNTTAGRSAYFNNVAGSGATVMGYEAMLNSNNQAGAFISGAVAIGYQALRGSPTPSANTGINNTAIGYRSLFNYTSGGNNTALGYQAGNVNTIGADNTFIGALADGSTNSLSNATALGANALVTASDRVKLGDNADVEFDNALMPAGDAGVVGEVLVSQGLGAAPIWSAAAGDGNGIYGGSGSLTSLTGVTYAGNNLAFNQGAATTFVNLTSGGGDWVFQTGGSFRSRFENDGDVYLSSTLFTDYSTTRVGIGTTAPNNHVTIYDANSHYLQIADDITGSASGDGVRLGVNGAGTGYLLWGEPSNNFHIGTNGDNNLIKVDPDNDYVSIGTGNTDPARKFEVNSAGGWPTMRLSSTSAGAGLEFVSTTDDDWMVATWAGSLALVNSTDNFTTQNDQFYFSSTSFHPWVSGSKTIGNASQYWGDIYLADRVFLNGFSGNAGDVLTSNAAGDAYWSAPAASINIYNSNGSLTADRTVTGGANFLSFTSTINNGFSVDGTTFSVDAANNRVGIGTTTPNEALQVNGNVYAQWFRGDVLNDKGTAQPLRLYGNGSVLFGSDNNNDGTGGFTWYNNGEGAVNIDMVLDDAGQLGIGTSTPGYLLDAFGNVGIGNNGQFTSYGFTTASTPRFSYGYNTNASGGYGSIAVGYSATASGVVSVALGQSVTASGYGGVAIGQNNTAAGANATALGENMTVATGADNSFGIALSGTHAINNPNVMSVMGGNVGIGTVAPTHPLEVFGLNNSTSQTSLASGLIFGDNQTTTGGVAIIGRVNQNNAVGAGNRTGVSGLGWYGQSNNYGLYGYGFGGNISYGVYATAGGAATNWAGYFAGNTFSTGTYQGSDAKLKKNITDFDNAVSILNNIPIKEYEYKQDEKHAQMNFPKGVQVGLLAEDLKKVLPELVKRNQVDLNNEKNMLNPDLNLEPEYYEFDVVNYTGLIPVTVKAIQEQDERIAKLEAEIEELKKLLLENK